MSKCKMHSSRPAGHSGPDKEYRRAVKFTATVKSGI